MEYSEARKARNESLFREVNERIEAAAKDFTPPERLEFVCECADVSCTQRLSLSLAEYEQVRADPARFVVAPGHTNEVDRVVEERDGYMIVEKKGDARKIAEQLDPRS